jgi:hypothetical protein
MKPASGMRQLAGTDGLTPHRSPAFRPELPITRSIARHCGIEKTGMSQKDRKVYPGGTSGPMKGAYRSGG